MNIKWFKNGEELKESNNVIQLESHENVFKLKFVQISLAQKGNYKIYIKEGHESEAYT